MLFNINLNNQAQAFTLQDCILVHHGQRLVPEIIIIACFLFQNKLKMFVLGEKDYKVTHPMMSAIISQSLLISRSRWTLQNVTFSLPSAMENHLEIHHQTYSTACVGTTVIVYEENPFAWNEPNKLVSNYTHLLQFDHLLS